MYVSAAGRMVDAGQEMVALGVCNVVGSFVQAMPTCGAFTRSAVSEASGVRTPLAGAYSGCLILLALTYLTPYFTFIPGACLSAVLVTAVAFMVDWRIVPRLYRTGCRYDLALVGLTFCASLWRGVEFGLLAGTCADLLRLAAPWSRPRVRILNNCTIQPEVGLLYPGVDRVRVAVAKLAASTSDTYIILDCTHVARVDYTALRGLLGLLAEHPRVHVSAASDRLQARLLAAAGPKDRQELQTRLHETNAQDTLAMLQNTSSQEKTPLLEHISLNINNNEGDRKLSLYDNVADT